MEKSLRLSVHQLVDFLLRKGDIDNRVFNRSSMSEGTRLHKVYQSSQGSDYLSEYPLSHEYYVDGVMITLTGFADGIIKTKSGEYIIDEIKTTVEELDKFRNDNLSWHLGQAKCYALMFAQEQHLSSISIRLYYIRQGKEKERLTDSYTFLISELEQEVMGYLEDYLNFYNIIFRQNEEKMASISKLDFPFINYREGQRELAKYSYSLAKQGGKLFIEAPTGIGKTISTLYPFVKSMELDEKEKIFYLTAKTSGKESAYKAMELLKDHGLVINDIVITAKEKMCPQSQKTCNPDECPYARDYYSKLQGVLRYCLTNYSTFNYDLMREIALENMMCPFELQLDLSLFCDVIICDYNYMYDPISYMKRYFDEDCSHYLALVDEAHNLTIRSSDMYSASIKLSSFEKMKKSMRSVKHSLLKRRFSSLTKMFKEIEEQFELGETVIEYLTDEQYKTIQSFIDTYSDINKNEHKIITRETADFYLEVNRFMKISELVNERYLTYVKKDNDELEIYLFCMDASNFLKHIASRIKGTIYFSATLSPMDYYVNTLGGDETDATLTLASPFSQKNFCLLVAPKVSTKYKNRDESYEIVREYIKSFIKNKVGNYFIYSPSYEYMNNLLKGFALDDVDIFIQEKDMLEKDKEEFLLHFANNPSKTTLGFLVIGGAFGEGIDLVSDRLIGAVVIGIGLPRINFRSNMISEYYKEKDMPGYEYAYINPGMNKVMQAVGRVIRDENDKGAALLIDERYMNRSYRDLFKKEWSHYEVVLSPKEVEEAIEKFYK